MSGAALTPAQRRARSNGALIEQGGSLINCRLSPAATAALAALVAGGTAKTAAVESALIAAAESRKKA